MKDFLINDINYFKNIVIKLFSLNQKNISNIFLELLLDENIIHNCLSPLLNENTLINIIIFGLDEKLQDYSFKDYKYFELITKIINSFFHVLNSEKKAYLYYFKSKLYYFNNNYEDSIDEANKGLAILNDSYQNLKSKINIHIAVILMEMGKSRECINILEKEFNPYKESKIYKKEGVEIAIELGRALNHSGHIESTLKVYDYVYQFENEIKSEYILSRLYEQKANVLNKKMYRILNYGLKKEKDLSEKEKDEVQNLFSEALDLYEKSISLLLKINAVWSYTGVAPEKINTYLSYSSSFKEIGIQECYTLINEIEPIFANFTTPFKTDFYLCKARYYEYLNQDTEVINSINIAIKNSNSLKNYNKLAVCYNYFAQYIYKSVILKKIANYQEVIIDALEKIESSIDYYYKNTLIKDNIILDDSIILRNNLRSLLDKN